MLRRALAAARIALGADLGPEVHHRLVPCPALPRRHQFVRDALGFGRRQPVTHPAGQNAAHVGIDDAGVHAERERLHCPSGVGAHARQRQQVVETGGYLAVVVLSDDRRRPPQVASSPGVAQSLPSSQHVGQLRCCALLRRRPTLGEGLKVRQHPFHLGLLQHDLGHQHQPWVAGAPPRQVALLGLPPADQLGVARATRIRRSVAQGLSPRRRRPRRCRGSGAGVRRPASRS